MTTKTMTTHKALVCALVAGCTCIGLAGEPQTYNVWNPSSPGMSPLEALPYADASNWADMEKGAPLGNDAVAVFDTPSGSAYEYIFLPDDMTIGAMANDYGRYLRFFGRSLTIDASKGFKLTKTTCSSLSGDLVAGRIRMDKDHNGIYADSVVVTGGQLSGHWSIMAPIRANNGVAITTGRIVHDMRWYATNSNPVRVGELNVSSNFQIGTAFEFYAPNKATAKSGVYEVQEGKTFARRVSGDAHTRSIYGQLANNLCPGSRVSSTAFDEGTYLKRIIDEEWIELSSPAKDNVPSADLSFEALTPVVTNHIEHVLVSIDRLQAFTSTRWAWSDEYVFLVDKFSSTGGNGSSCLNLISSCYPAKFIVKDGASYTIGLKLSQSDVVFDSCGGSVVSGFPNASDVCMSGKDTWTRITVNGNDYAKIANTHDYNGELRKEGTGTLELGLKGSPGSIPNLTISGGMLDFSTADSGWSVATATIAAGAGIGVSGGGSMTLSGGTLAKGAVLAAGADSQMELGESVSRTACSVSAGVGGRVVIAGSNALHVTGLSGGGDITGSVTSDPGAVLTVVVADDGFIGELKVSGTADLSSGGSVVLSGNVAKLAAGSYKIVSASNSISGSWATAVQQEGRFKVRVRVVGNAIWLDVIAPGLMMLFR